MYIYIIYVPNFYVFIFWATPPKNGILVRRPGIEPSPSAVKTQSPNHWTAREFP